MSEQLRQFGPELRRLRLAAGLTLDQLARLVHYSKGQLSKVETGRKPPSLELARLCDAALGAGGALAALVRKQTSPAVVSENSRQGEVWSLRMDKNGSVRFESVSRREAAAVGAVSMLAVGMGGLRITADAQGATLVAASRSTFTEFRRMGQTAGPVLLLPALIAQTHSIEQLAMRSGRRTRAQLLAVAARYAEYTGWMAQEAGDDRAALWWTDRAVELASAGGDFALAAYASVRRALVCLLNGDLEQSIALAGIALRSPSATPRVRGLAAQQRAQAYALNGDHGACMDSLDRARDELDRDAERSTAPVIGASHLPDVVSMYTAWCLYHLGRPERAASLFAEQSAVIGPHALRTRTRWGVRLALAHAAAGEIDQACAVLTPLLGGFQLVHSATIAADLRRMARLLARHHRHPAVRELNPRLTAVLADSNCL